MLLAAFNLQFLPPLLPGVLVGLLALAAVAVLAVGWLLGPANPVARRGSLWALRGTILALVVLIIFNPASVQQLPGPVQRPEIFYLVDTSASMQMGNPLSRWEQSKAMIAGARDKATRSAAVVKPFRFGQRLAAIDQPDQVGLAVAAAPVVTPAANNENSKSSEVTRPRPVAPLDGDTRLQAALKQISSRFGRVPPVGIVVFSDGRVHDETGLDQIAAQFAKLTVPIHVVPIGDTGKGGDVAIAAVVAPPRVRKFTEVEVQVFVRSFGYDGKRGEVQLIDIGEGERAGRKLASLPITLQSGYQSVSLSFRTDLSTRKLRVQIPALEDEVSDKNNQLSTEMAIDRTKIRVLYVEGSPQPITSLRVGDRTQYKGPFTDLKTALTDDEDIECVVLAATGGAGRLTRIAEYNTADGVRGFPTTVAELSAFDAMILSDVAAEAFTETQLTWIEEWIRVRGGGLCMVGGEHSFASGGWDQTPLAQMLPVDMLPGGNDWVPGETVRISPELPPSLHPLWNLVSDEKLNRQIAGAFPSVVGVNRWAGARPNRTTVLATTDVAGAPVSAAVEPPPFSIRSLSAVLPGTTQPTAADAAPAKAATAESIPVIVAGHYSRGRTLAAAFPITSPSADELVQKWGTGDNRYYAKFCRNLVYWLTENSAIGRRRLVATADKRFYRPGETITVQAATYDESASPTKNYRVTAMVESQGAVDDSDPNAPIKWPAGLTRDSGESGQYLIWGEEFQLPAGGPNQAQHAISLPLMETLSSGTSSQSLRIELTAYEDQTQVDSTSLEIQILHDPFEQQNPFPDHELLKRVAAASGGKVLQTDTELAQVLQDVPPNVGPPVIKRSPLWSNPWVLLLIIGLFTVEWSWRRHLGLA